MFGDKLSWCQIVPCQIVLVPNCPFLTLGAKLFGTKLSYNPVLRSLYAIYPTSLWSICDIYFTLLWSIYDIYLTINHKLVLSTNLSILQK